MAEPAVAWEIPEPDVSHLITEDDEPVESFYQDIQQRILVDALNTSWPEGRPFISAVDVAIFATTKAFVSTVISSFVMLVS